MHNFTKLNNRGQSLIEFAVSLVLLLLILAGTVDLGRAFFAYIIIRDAAQEGALYGAVNADDPDLETLIAGRVKKAFSDPEGISSTPINVDALNVTASVLGNACAGVHQDLTDHDQDGDTTEYLSNAVIVQVDYGFPVSMPFLGAAIGSQEINMSSSIEDTIMVPICK